MYGPRFFATGWLGGIGAEMRDLPAPAAGDGHWSGIDGNDLHSRDMAS